MSYAHTYVVPADPAFVPNEEQAARGQQFLDDVLRGHYEVEVQTRTEPRLYSTEENWTRFQCPRCRQTVQYNGGDATLGDWWYEELYGLHDPNQVLTVPCCGASVAGKEFDFGADAVFSRFALVVRECHLLEDGYWKPGDREGLEDALGFKTRILVAQGT